MKGLWKANATRSHKWLISLFLIAMLGALPPMLWRSFVPSDTWQLQALGLSAVLAGAFLIWLRHLYQRGEIKASGPWLDYGPLKRLGMALLCIAFLVFILWLNLAASLPMLYTHWRGTEASMQSMAQKKRTSGRYACHRQLKLDGIHYLFFEFCMDEDRFNRLPDQPLPALLTVRQSHFGVKVESIRLSTSAKK